MIWKSTKMRKWSNWQINVRIIQWQRSLLENMRLYVPSVKFIRRKEENGRVIQEICKFFQNCAWQDWKWVYIKSCFATGCLIEKDIGFEKIRKKFKKRLDKSEIGAKLNSTQQKQAKVCVMIERFGWSLFESFSGSSFAVGADVLLKGFRFWKKSKNFEKSIWQIGKRC